VNQRLKPDRLPSALTLAGTAERIVGWWRTAYLAPDDEWLPARFGHEARASLLSLRAAAADACDPKRVFAAVGLQRLRPRHDQQVPEWTA
jgi:hypothetical protein